MQRCCDTCTSQKPAPIVETRRILHHTCSQAGQIVPVAPGTERLCVLQVLQKKPGAGQKLVQSLGCVCQQHVQAALLGRDQLVELYYFVLRPHAPALLRSSAPSHFRVKLAVLELCQAYMDQLLNPGCSLGAAAAKQQADALQGMLWELRVPHCDLKAMRKLLLSTDGPLTREKAHATSKSTKPATTEENGLLNAVSLALHNARGLESRQVDAALKLLQTCLPQPLPQAPDAKLWAVVGSPQMLPLWALYFNPLVIAAQHCAPAGDDCLGANRLEPPPQAAGSQALGGTKVTWSDYTVSEGVDALVARQRPDALLLLLIARCPVGCIAAALEPMQSALKDAATATSLTLATREGHVRRQVGLLVAAVADSCGGDHYGSAITLQQLLDGLLHAHEEAAAASAPHLAANVLLPLLDLVGGVRSQSAPLMLLHCSPQLHAAWSALATAAPRQLAAWLAAAATDLLPKDGDDADAPAGGGEAPTARLPLAMATLCNRAAAAVAADPQVLLGLLQWYLQQASAAPSPSPADTDAGMPAPAAAWVRLAEDLSASIARTAPAMLLTTALAAHARASDLSATTGVLRNLASQPPITGGWSSSICSGTAASAPAVAALAAALQRQADADADAILHSPVLELVLVLVTSDRSRVLPTPVKQALCHAEAAIVPQVLLHAASAAGSAARQAAVEACIMLMSSFPSADDGTSGLDLEDCLCGMLACAPLHVKLRPSLFQAAVSRLATRDAAAAAASGGGGEAPAATRRVAQMVQQWIQGAEAGSIPAELLAWNAGWLHEAGRHPSTGKALNAALQAHLPRLSCVLTAVDQQRWPPHLVAPVLHLLGRAVGMTEPEMEQLHVAPTAPGTQASAEGRPARPAADGAKFFCTEASSAAAGGRRQQTTTSQQFLDTKQLLQRKAAALLAGPAAVSLAQGLLAGGTEATAGAVRGSPAADMETHLVLTPTTLDNLQLVAEVLAETLDPVILEGGTGVGKSATIAEAARRTKNKLVRFNMSSQVRVCRMAVVVLTTAGARHVVSQLNCRSSKMFAVQPRACSG
jgi:hypothetical protein